MSTLLKALVSPVQRGILMWSASALVLGMAGQASAQTAAAPAPAASSPAAIAAQQGLSESVLRQAQGPYRMILNQPVVVGRPKPAVAAPSGTARAADPAAAAPTATAAAPVPLSAAARKAALEGADASTAAAAVAPRAAPAPAAVAAVAPTAAPAALPPPFPPPLPPVTAAPAPAALPVSPVALAAPSAAPAPQPVAAAVAAVEKPLIALRQEEPLLAGPLARERPTGVVQVGFNVNPDGSTGDVSVVSSSNRKLNSAVTAAVSKWRYQPLEAVRRVEVAIEFKND